MQSQTKSFKYAGGRLVCCPCCREGDVPAGEEGVATGGGSVFTGGLLGSTCGVSRPCWLSSLLPLHCFQMEPLMRGVFALPSPYLDLEVSVAGLVLELEGLAWGQWAHFC